MDTSMRLGRSLRANCRPFTRVLPASIVSGSRRGAVTAAAAPKPQTLVLKIAEGKEFKLETGEIGRQANGSVMATEGETVLYATACCDNAPSGDGSMVPLSVNYGERLSSAGLTNSGFQKRDSRPSEAEILIARLVDRPIRPMFNKGWATETQVLEWVMSYDESTLPEPLAITAAAASLLLSDIPFDKGVAGVRVGLLPSEQPGGADRIVLNPSAKEMTTSRLDLMMAGTKDAVLMIEGFCDFLTDEEMLVAIEAGNAAISSMCIQMEAWAKTVGKKKTRRNTLVSLPDGLEERVKALVMDKLVAVYSKTTTKEERSRAEYDAHHAVDEALLGRNAGDLADSEPDAAMPSPIQVALAFKKVASAALRKVVLDSGKRIDGRGTTDIRPINCRASVLPRTHGSSLFTRGETQALCVTTLGSSEDATYLGGVRAAVKEGEKRSNFYLHYFFPPSSVGETGRIGAPGRRELGHGELAQRALAPILPKADVFPYNVRVESTITESNGSSSMASVCGGCLSMMDAGVPIIRPVAGIAMGLILEPDGRFVVLSDILGTEDSLGDMDFKVAGDRDHITAFQMDIKVEGITIPIMRQALSQAKAGRQHILAQMALASPPPSMKLSKHAPRMLRLPLEDAQKGQVIGVGGKTIRAIVERSGATTVTISPDGYLEILAPSEVTLAKALEFVQLLTEEPTAGKIYRNRTVATTQAFGAFVELGPDCLGMVHLSELDVGNVAEVGRAVSIGDKVDVMVLPTLQGGNNKLRLSIRAAKLSDAGQWDSKAMKAVGDGSTRPSAPDRPSPGPPGPSPGRDPQGRSKDSRPPVRRP